LKTICSNIFEEIKLTKREEYEINKLTPLKGNYSYSNNILKTAEMDTTYNELASIRKCSTVSEKEERRNSTGDYVSRKNSKAISATEDNSKMIGESQPFPTIEFSGETMHATSESNNFENATYSIIMDTSFNVNIFSGNSNSSNIYSSESSDISIKNSQSMDMLKFNTESSETKRIIYEQIFRELVIPEEFWTAIFKKMNNFNEEYIEYYKKIYDIYINPNGVVPIKLKNNDAKAIKLKINKSEYSYDMYFPVSLIYKTFVLFD